MSEPCKPCDETRCVVTPDVLTYSLEGLPNQPLPPAPPPPAPQIPNDPVFYTTSCGTGTRLVITGPVPAWITVSTFQNKVLGAAGAFFRATKTAANLTAQAELDAWVASVLTSGALSCHSVPLVNLWGWWKADAITGYSDGDGLNTWVDSSGHDNHMLKVSDPSRPLYKTNQLNGLPVVRFGDVSGGGGPTSTRWFEVPRFYSAFTAGELFMVIKRDADGLLGLGMDGWMSFGGNAATDAYYQYGTPPGTGIGSHGPLSSFGSTARNDQGNYGGDLGISLANWNVVNITAEAGLNGWQFYLNGINLITSPGGVNTIGWAAPNDSWMGRSTVGFNEFFQGVIAEIIFYSAVQTADDRAIIMDYFGTKWGV